MFSVGAILLEILTGFPLWLPLKGRVESGNQSMTAYGLFAVQNKAVKKILLKQKEVIGNLIKTLKRYKCFTNNKELFDLLQRMLSIDPMSRISPEEALKHPFITK